MLYFLILYIFFIFLLILKDFKKVVDSTANKKSLIEFESTCTSISKKVLIKDILLIYNYNIIDIDLRNTKIDLSIGNMIKLQILDLLSDWDYKLIRLLIMENGIIIKSFEVDEMNWEELTLNQAIKVEYIDELGEKDTSLFVFFCSGQLTYKGNTSNYLLYLYEDSIELSMTTDLKKYTFFFHCGLFITHDSYYSVLEESEEDNYYYSYFYVNNINITNDFYNKMILALNIFRKNHFSFKNI